MPVCLPLASHPGIPVTELANGTWARARVFARNDFDRIPRGAQGNAEREDRTVAMLLLNGQKITISPSNGLTYFSQSWTQRLGRSSRAVATGGLDAVVATIPTDESGNAVIDGRPWREGKIALECGHVGDRIFDIARLHRQQIFPRLAIERRL
jgi:hypothetical protein